MYPAVQGLVRACRRDGQRARDGLLDPVHVFYAVYLACGKKLEHGRHVIRWAVGGAQHHRIVACAGLPSDCFFANHFVGFFAKGTRLQPVVAHKSIVKPAHAGKTTQTRHLGHRQTSVGEQLLGSEQSARLPILQWRYAPIRLKNTTHMPFAHTQTNGERLHRRRPIVPRIGRVQQAGGLLGQDAGGILHRPHWRADRRCQFRPATQTGAKARLLGLRRQYKEAAVFTFWTAHLAYGSAVNAGRRDGGEESTVKARIPRFKCQVASVVAGGRVLACWI